MNKRNFSILGACLALCTLSAQAQPAAQDSNSSVKDSYRQERCSDRYAASVGRLAYVETRLTLSDAQKPLFDRWKNARLNNAKEHQALCVARTERNRAEKPTPVDRMTRQEDRLKRRLAQIEAERPVFTALYTSLNPEQQEVLSHLHGHRMERGGFRHAEMTGPHNFGHRRHGSPNFDTNPGAMPTPG
jgi:LTXXQ motif family protein